jgi:plasmid replication initiation protein
MEAVTPILSGAPIRLSKRKKEVIKHSSAVQITNSITLLQRRAWNILLARAFDELSNSDRFQIRVKDLVEMLDYRSNDDAYLKEALEKLSTTAVRWNILRKDKSEWGVFPLLAGAVIKQGVLTYAFSPFLRERLRNPRMYARISLSLQNKFQSKHALALYELCLDYFDFERSYGETPQIAVNEFRELMGVDVNEYPVFARLNEKVIKKAVHEINELTDLFVTVRYNRFQRKIDSIKFCINRKTEISIPFSNGEALEIVTEIKTPEEYDLFFSRLGNEQQKKILDEAYSLLPDFVREYSTDVETLPNNRTTQVLLKQNRNVLLDKLIKPAFSPVSLQSS